MAFLDNSGDIILDAVLTDTGRMRLAKGDGSFRIAKFALGDDEINYGAYDKTNPEGSSFFDIEILQTPIMEAFSDNEASMKSKLISIPQTNLIYLPVLKLNESFEASTARRTAVDAQGVFIVCVDEETEELFNVSAGGGIMLGHSPSNGGSYVRVDQGLDTTEISPSRVLDAGLYERQYIVEIDTRLGTIIDKDGVAEANPSYIDDDFVASYFFSQGTDTRFVEENGVRSTSSNQVVAGPRGTVVKFKITSSLELVSSLYLFLKFGSESVMKNNAGVDQAVYHIDSTVRVMGATTGSSIDIPVRYIRKKNS